MVDLNNIIIAKQLKKSGLGFESMFFICQAIDTPAVREWQFCCVLGLLF